MSIGRPKKEIDWEVFEKLLTIQCPIWEIANFFECSVDTIERAAKRHYKKPFAEVCRQHKAKGRISLRRVIFQRATNPNCPPALQIFAAKNYLGMMDNPMLSDDEDTIENYQRPSSMRDDD